MRQGCPLYSLLNSLVVEPLAFLVKKDKQIKGITSLSGTEYKILQYADDTNIMVHDEDSTDRDLIQISKYSQASPQQQKKTQHQQI